MATVIGIAIGIPFKKTVGIGDTGAPDYLFEDGVNFLFEDGVLYEFEN